MAHKIGMLLALASTTNALSVLVVGVSGGTGQRAFRGLVAGGLDAPKISFLTRNPQRPAAQALSALGATPVVADLDDAASLARAVSDATYDGVYVHGLAGDEKRIDTEEAPRAARLAAALRSLDAPPLVVYNSAAADDDTGIPRIEQKHAVERAFQGALPRTAMLRAHLFMEELWKDYTRPGIKKGTYAFSVPRDKPLCLTSVKDMGVVAARCLLEARTGTLEVVSDVRTPGGLADDFAAAQGGAVVHKQAWALYWISKFALPELHQIMNFYRKTDFSPAIDARDAFAASFAELPPLQSFASFLEETKWSDADRTYEDLARP